MNFKMYFEKNASILINFVNVNDYFLATINPFLN